LRSEWGLLLMASECKTLNVLRDDALPDFDLVMREHGLEGLRRFTVTTLQINVGKLCNQACHHCHVEAGPRRTEIMPIEVVDRILSLLSASPSIQVVDITGGAPELNPSFKRLVLRSRILSRHVVDRCNLTVFFEPGQEDLPKFLAANHVEVAASLPCYTAENVDRQRGKGVFDKSIRALRLLNSLGYGRPGSELLLNLVYNPLGASLPPEQAKLEADYKKQLGDRFGIEFHRLFTMTNMPIRRFSDFLTRSGQMEGYMSLLVNRLNPATLNQLMCRALVSVGWDGKLYDCDFNQMLDLETPSRKTIWDIDSFSELTNREIATGGHCFGCTAGAGSSCGGSLQ
jgi:radical SAM/Cys-rich protein